MTLPATFRRDLLMLAVLVALHEGMKRALADGALVTALFSPGGAHSAATLLVGLLLIACRLTLFIGVPGWFVATAVSAIVARRSAAERSH
ncbi:MAG TPA: hypothetical protein VH062_25980 [Polyangiaceae bacterium]|jgi:hypothetical protein|nr:hypothetical protein [Polyangiaceae bacterium]